MLRQECIPVGCVPSAAVAVGGCLPGMGGLPGVCVSQHALGRGCVSQHALGRGVSGPVHAWIPQDRILDTCLCKHYLSATTLRTVKTMAVNLDHKNFVLLGNSTLVHDLSPALQAEDCTSWSIHNTADFKCSQRDTFEI